MQFKILSLFLLTSLLNAYDSNGGLLLSVGYVPGLKKIWLSESGSILKSESSFDSGYDSGIGLSLADSKRGFCPVIEVTLNYRYLSGNFKDISIVNANTGYVKIGIGCGYNFDKVNSIVILPSVGFGYSLVSLNGFNQDGPKRSLYRFGKAGIDLRYNRKFEGYYVGGGVGYEIWGIQKNLYNHSNQSEFKGYGPTAHLVIGF